MYFPKPQLLTETIDLISSSRLSSYNSFFRPKNDHELYGLYCWNDAVSSCFMRLIGIIEISLRNRFHNALSQELWNSRTSVGTKESNDWYNQLRLTTKSEEKIKAITHYYVGRGRSRILVPKTNPPSCNQVVASMTYGFWPRLLDTKQTTSGGTLLWENVLPEVFKNHHKRADAPYWSKLSSQDAIYARLDLIGDVRNRVAHFEPLWKLKDMLEEKRTRPNVTRAVIKSAPTTPAEAIDHLQTIYRNTTQLLHWLSKERAIDYSECEINSALQYLLTENAIYNFKNSSATQNVRLSSLTKSWGGKLSLRGKKPCYVHDKKTIAGKYYPIR